MIKCQNCGHIINDSVNENVNAELEKEDKVESVVSNEQQKLQEVESICKSEENSEDFIPVDENSQNVEEDQKKENNCAVKICVNLKEVKKKLLKPKALITLGVAATSAAVAAGIKLKMNKK